MNVAPAGVPAAAELPVAVSAATKPAAPAAPEAPGAPSLERVRSEVASIVDGAKIRLDLEFSRDSYAGISGQFGARRGYDTLEFALRAAQKYNHVRANDTATAIANAAGRYVLLHTDTRMNGEWDHTWRSFRSNDPRLVGLTTPSGSVVPHDGLR